MYDELNQLIRENNHELLQYVCYTYDHSGNIQSKTSHAWAGTVLDTDTYIYGNTQWSDLLTNYNGTAISYDASGNPLCWRNASSLNWQGCKLTSLTLDTMGMQGMTFSYNSEGIRTKKSHYNHNDGNMYGVTYVLDGTKILSQTYLHSISKQTYTVKFFYDENDAPIAMEYDGNYYYYRTNIQGDIEGIYNASGTLVVSYSYDAWGNILSTTGTLASTVGEINPFRYRGYYYDTETGWYYLQSRYYDPTVGRFLNADEPLLIGATGTLLSLNLFAYCENSAVSSFDLNGYLYISYRQLDKVFKTISDMSKAFRIHTNKGLYGTLAGLAAPYISALFSWVNTILLVGQVIFCIVVVSAVYFAGIVTYAYYIKKQEWIFR